jgi:hypothetical protein
MLFAIHSLLLCWQYVIRTAGTDFLPRYGILRLVFWRCPKKAKAVSLYAMKALGGEEV